MQHDDSPVPSSLAFPLIVLGAQRWLEYFNGDTQQLDELSIWASHYLHAQEIRRRLPASLTLWDRLQTLSQPLARLFEAGDLPPTFDWQYGDSLLYDGGAQFVFSPQAEDYLNSLKPQDLGNLSQLINQHENDSFRVKHGDLLQRYQAAEHPTERRALVERYANWRSFFTVERCIVNPSKDGLIFEWGEYQAFYELARPQQRQLAPQGRYAISPAVGLLYPDSSGKMQPLVNSAEFDSTKISYRPAHPDDWVLKRTHQRRILIPGIPENRLFQAVEAHPAVREVQRYPGIDRYDARVTLHSGQVHAVDVKDYQQPDLLIRQLEGKRALPIIDSFEEDLRWDTFFYLLPAARVREYPSGAWERLQALAQRHPSLFVMTIESYQERLNHV